MKFENIFFIGFTPNAYNKKDDFPLEVSINSLYGNFQHHLYILPPEKVFYWDVEYVKWHNISKDNILNYGKTPEEVIHQLNKFYRLSKQPPLFSNHFAEDSFLLSQVLKHSFSQPDFTIRDFYKGINVYQKRLLKHFLHKAYSNRNHNQQRSFGRNTAHKEAFEKIVDIKNNQSTNY